MKQILTIYLLDDDPIILKSTGQALEENLRPLRVRFDIQLVMFSQPEELLRHLEHATSLELLLADIDLGSKEHSGITIAREVRRKFPQCSIIYLTAYLSYATDIYETRPLYFILKEEAQERMPRAVELFLEDLESRRETLTVSAGREQQVLRLRDILYCEHRSRKTEIHLTDKVVTVNETIPDIMEQLPARRFCMCHRGYIVSLGAVESYRRFEITLRSGEVIPISRSRYEVFHQSFVAYLAR